MKPKPVPPATEARTVLVVYVRPGTKQKLEDLASRKGVAVSKLVQAALDEYMG